MKDIYCNRRTFCELLLLGLLGGCGQPEVKHFSGGFSQNGELAPEVVENNANYLLNLYKSRLDITGIYRDENHQVNFFKEIVKMAYRLNPANQFLANQIAAVINFESGFSSSIRNAAGSGATGLIQFMPETASGLGTNVEELAGMDPVGQLAYVESYLQPKQNNAKVKNGTGLQSICDVYMSVLYPIAVGSDSNTAILTGPYEYSQNSGLDLNRDGIITISEASQAVINASILQGENINILMNLNQTLTDTFVPVSP